MRRKLTDRLIKTLRPPASGRLVVADSEAQGLSLRITPTGAKSWLVRFQLPRQPQTACVVGPYPAISLAEARERARDIVTAAKKGRDLPVEEKRIEAERQKAAATSRTVRQLAAEFVENHCKAHQKHWRDDELRLRNHVLGPIGDRAATDIRRADIVELLDDLEHKKKLRQQVNRVRAVLSSMFKYACEREIVLDNPVSGTRPRKVETERTRVLNDDELRSIWRALDGMPEPAAAFVRVLMLTACRRDEIRLMEWREVDLKAGVWTLPVARNKGGRPHEVPMSRQMVELLASMPRRGSFVFTTTGDKPWSGHDKIKPVLDRESGVKGWVFHDLRRTARSRFAEMGISYEIAERLLGHAVTKIERTYNRHSYLPEKRRALQAWADRLMAIVGDGRGAGNVVGLKRGT